MTYSEGKGTEPTGIERDSEGITEEMTVAELKKKRNNMVEISMIDIPKFKAYLDENGATYEIYRYGDRPEYGILVLLDDKVRQIDLFDSLVDRLEGCFWDYITVKDKTILQKVDG
jgi:hypothetical protein